MRTSGGIARRFGLHHLRPDHFQPSPVIRELRDMFWDLTAHPIPSCRKIGRVPRNQTLARVGRRSLDHNRPGHLALTSYRNDILLYRSVFVGHRCGPESRGGGKDQRRRKAALSESDPPLGVLPPEEKSAFSRVLCGARIVSPVQVQKHKHSAAAE
jgi:hypothetical protein